MEDLLKNLVRKAKLLTTAEDTYLQMSDIYFRNGRKSRKAVAMVVHGTSQLVSSNLTISMKRKGKKVCLSYSNTSRNISLSRGTRMIF